MTTFCFKYLYYLVKNARCDNRYTVPKEILLKLIFNYDKHNSKTCKIGKKADKMRFL